MKVILLLLVLLPLMSCQNKKVDREVNSVLQKAPYLKKELLKLTLDPIYVQIKSKDSGLDIHRFFIEFLIRDFKQDEYDANLNVFENIIRSELGKLNSKQLSDEKEITKLTLNITEQINHFLNISQVEVTEIIQVKKL